MKRVLIYYFLVSVFIAYGDNISEADSLFKTGNNYGECKSKLESMYNSSDGKDRAEIAWRLSRVYLVLGEKETAKESKREVFGKGIEYAEKAIALNPNDHNAYMWHSANVGRECQTHNLMSQASKVPVMIGDLTTIIDKLNRIDCSEAWQALSEIYYHHPFKSTDSAINFARRASVTIPKDEMRLSTYLYFATILYERNLSSAERQKMISENGEKFQDSTKSNIDKYSYYDGGLGASYVHKWSTKPFSQMSDSEEAKQIVMYAISLYKKCSKPTVIDTNDYNNLEKLLKSH